jgi:enoyl-CoA hydratase/carnithine racemase
MTDQNRPPQNLLDHDTIGELAELAASLDADPDLRRPGDQRRVDPGTVRGGGTGLALAMARRIASFDRSGR